MNSNEKCNGCKVMPGSSHAHTARGSSSQTSPPVVIKKYANRRLYNTEISAYITLDDVRTMVCDGIGFVVEDAKTGEDLTAQILMQVIAEQNTQHSAGAAIMPEAFLRLLIQMYDEQMRPAVMPYWQTVLQQCEQLQNGLRHYIHNASEAAASGTPWETLQAQQQWWQQQMQQWQTWTPPSAPHANAHTNDTDDAPPSST